MLSKNQMSVYKFQKKSDKLKAPCSTENSQIETVLFSLEKSSSIEKTRNITEKRSLNRLIGFAGTAIIIAKQHVYASAALRSGHAGHGDFTFSEVLFESYKKSHDPLYSG